MCAEIKCYSGILELFWAIFTFMPKLYENITVCANIALVMGYTLYSISNHGNRMAAGRREKEVTAHNMHLKYLLASF